jgi:carboxyl-terminal processing protease
MKQIWLLFLTTTLFLKMNPVSAQSKEVRFLIDTCISIMKENAVNAKNVNWKVVRENALERSGGLTSPYELGPVMRYLYRSINDFHGSFFYKDSTFQWHHNDPVLSEAILNEFKKGVRIETEILANNIGYLRIPSMPVSTKADFYKKAQDLNDSLCSLFAKGIIGIILDLRLDGGGAMHPMILGVEQLLRQGRVGSFQVKKREDWFIKDNGFFVDTTKFSGITPKCSVNAQRIPVIMLISPATGSAAECLIIAFKRRKKTILLGSETAGYVTVNAGFPINDTAFMNLSVGYSADRRGKIYKKAIKPGISFNGPDDFNDIKNDKKVMAAVYLLQHRYN